MRILKKAKSHLKSDELNIKPTRKRAKKTRDRIPPPNIEDIKFQIKEYVTPVKGTLISMIV